MISPIIGKGFFLRCAPRGRSALVCVLEADDVVDVVDVDKVTGFVSVKAYGGIGFVTAVVEVFAVVGVCQG